VSAEQDKVRSIAERVASRLGDGGAGGETTSRAGEGGDELAQLRASLRDLQQRLVQIESRVAGGGERERQTAHGAGSSSSQQSAARAPQQFLSSTYVPATHPSQERFGINEAVSELVDFFEGEKTCTVEPGGKPCDHCAMCSTRGF
jgi:hypothetical protein